MTSHLAVEALATAVTRRGGDDVVAGCVVHATENRHGDRDASSTHSRDTSCSDRWEDRLQRRQGAHAA